MAAAYGLVILVPPSRLHIRGSMSIAVTWAASLLPASSLVRDFLATVHCRAFPAATTAVTKKKRSRHEKNVRILESRASRSSTSGLPVHHGKLFSTVAASSASP